MREKYHHLHVRTIGTHLFREKSLDIKMNSEYSFLPELLLEGMAKILMQPYLIKIIKMIKKEINEV
jgi:hypothetical protein